VFALRVLLLLKPRRACRSQGAGVVAALGKFCPKPGISGLAELYRRPQAIEFANECHGTALAAGWRE
jgi:hypothetical protein